MVVPMRHGYARSSGTYRELDCDMDGNGQLQADDVVGALRYLRAQRWVDPERIVVAGQSYGGLAALAFGTRGVPGVRGLINFAGGLRLYGSDCPWRASLIAAFRDYGAHTTVPSLWFYGENDRHFPPTLVQRMYRAYVAAGGPARLIAYGPYRDDAHGMGASWGGVSIWWPATARFLRAIGMPTRKSVTLPALPRLPDTHFAPLRDAAALPYMDGKGRAAYREFLRQPLPRAFALSASGAWSWAEDGDDPKAKVLADCRKVSVTPCRLYAVNDRVVWRAAPPQLAAGAAPGAS